MKRLNLFEKIGLGLLVFTGILATNFASLVIATIGISAVTVGVIGRTLSEQYLHQKEIERSNQEIERSNRADGH